ncbi:GL15756 [Drosophila persimilis]|uniref:GL15756 n=1 Tax=Drosophila persimilis TaxID=7234 RepID=B4HCW7_DROPE|nr:GL15756 [Drosophila persimilis]
MRNVNVSQAAPSGGRRAGDGLKVTLSSDGSLDTNDSFNSHRHHPLNHQDAIGGIMGMAPNALSSAPVTIGASTDLLTPNAAATRRRRKLPEIPKNQKSSILHLLGGTNYGSLADEFRTGGGGIIGGPLAAPRTGQQRSFLSLKCGYLMDEDSSPDSERLQSLGDVDSGHSTAHSPNDFKSMSPQITSPVSFNKKEKKPCIDYFYSLKNVSFCAFHPRDHRFIGFITKHPIVQRFACHVFKGSESTRPVAEAVGRAFQRFYQKFIETAYPIEDIYIE